MPYVACTRCAVRVYTLAGMAGRDACPVCDAPLPGRWAEYGRVPPDGVHDAGSPEDASASERAA
jgi:hypothetical protein